MKLVIIIRRWYVFRGISYFLHILSQREYWTTHLRNRVVVCFQSSGYILSLPFFTIHRSFLSSGQTIFCGTFKSASCINSLKFPIYVKTSTLCPPISTKSITSYRYVYWKLIQWFLLRSCLKLFETGSPVWWW